MELLKKNRNNRQCFVANLVCGTKKVYPCCRAHRLEQVYGKKYHLPIDAPNLYKNLRNIITDTDLCTHCPHIYTNPKRVLLATMDT